MMTLSAHIADSALQQKQLGAADMGKFEERDADGHCGATEIERRYLEESDKSEKREGRAVQRTVDLAPQ